MGRESERERGGRYFSDTVQIEANCDQQLGSQQTLSAVGQADDTVLISTNIFKLYHIFKLTMDYCTKYNVELSSSKTKLMEILPPRGTSFVPFNPIQLNGKTVEFVHEAEHVGVLRSSEGNIPNLLNRVSAFKKALGSLTSCGLAPLPP